MTPPAQAAHRFAAAVLLGLGLGLIFDFFRPLHRRCHWPWDLLFVLILFYAWLYHSFAICRGDIRIDQTAGLGAGFVLWELTLRRPLGPLFSNFWRIFLYPAEKISVFFKKIAKKGLAYGKKWGTIGWNRYRTRGGTAHGTKAKDPLQSAKAEAAAAGHRSGGADPERGHSDHRPLSHPKHPGRNRRPAR